MATSEKERKRRLLAFLPDARITPACPHVSEGCGGCLFQDVPYEDQVTAKEKFLAEIYGQDVRVTPCPEPLGYRNRMDFVAAFGKKGLRQRGKFAQVVDIKDCMLLPVHARDLYELVREAFSHVQDYNYIRHEGFLRYAVIRASKVTEETMLIVTTTTPQEMKQEEEFKELLTQLHEQAKLQSLHWTVNDSKTDVSVGEQFWHIGQEWIVDEIANREFRVYPTTFFQANTVMAGDMFQRAIGYAKGRVLDLYSGVGVISIIAAQQEEVTDVTGVELVPSSVEAAKENAILNGVPVEKCRFICSDVKIFLNEPGEPFDTVICDPARPGLEGACDILLEHLPKRIIYISCNPFSHKEDVDKLGEKYTMSALDAYDLFPQTPHVEVLSVLDRKDTV